MLRTKTIKYIVTKINQQTIMVVTYHFKSPLPSLNTLNKQKKTFYAAFTRNSNSIRIIGFELI